MSQLWFSSACVNKPEFSIYVYHHEFNIEDGFTDWERVSKTTCLQDAFHQAQLLFDSDDFKKVEIKKKYFDPKYQRLIDTPCKVYQDRQKISRRSKIIALFSFSCICGLGVVALPFLAGF